MSNKFDFNFSVNVSYSSSVFSSTSLTISPKEKSQVNNLRVLNEDFQNVIAFKELMKLQGTALSTTSADNVMGDIGQLVKIKSQSVATLSTTMSDNVTNVMVSSFTALPQSTLSLTKNAHIQSFVDMYKTICTPIAKALKPSFVDETTMLSTFAHMNNQVIVNVTPVDQYRESGMLTLNEYITECQKTAKSYVNTLPTFTLPQKDIMIVTFIISQYPYLVASYIAAYIRIAGDDQTSRKPDSFVVRQFAVLVMRVYTVQIMSILHAISGNNTFTLRPAFETTLTSIRDEYTSGADMDSYYADLMRISTNNMVYQEDINNMNKDVVAAKSNVEKALLNDQRATKTLARSKLLLNIWIILLVILVIGVVIFYFISNADNNYFYYMYGVCAVFIVAVFINGLVQVIQTTNK